MSEQKETRKRKEEKPLTPLQVLKKQPKAMQVGPQYHLRKSFFADAPKKLKGGNA